MNAFTLGAPACCKQILSDPPTGGELYCVTKRKSMNPKMFCSLDFLGLLSCVKTRKTLYHATLYFILSHKPLKPLSLYASRLAPHALRPSNPLTGRKRWISAPLPGASRLTPGAFRPENNLHICFNHIT